MPQTTRILIVADFGGSARFVICGKNASIQLSSACAYNSALGAVVPLCEMLRDQDRTLRQRVRRALTPSLPLHRGRAKGDDAPHAAIELPAAGGGKKGQGKLLDHMAATTGRDSSARVGS